MTGELGYGEFSEVLRTARKLLTSVRALDGEDLNAPDRTADFSVDIRRTGRTCGSCGSSLAAVARQISTRNSNQRVSSVKCAD